MARRAEPSAASAAANRVAFVVMGGLVVGVQLARWLRWLRWRMFRQPL